MFYSISTRKIIPWKIAPMPLGRFPPTLTLTITLTQGWWGDLLGGNLPGSNFTEAIFSVTYSINWSDLIVWLPLLLKILGNMCIAIVCFPGCNITNFETNLIFLIKQFFYRDIFLQKELLKWSKYYFHHF